MNTVNSAGAQRARRLIVLGYTEFLEELGIENPSTQMLMRAMLIDMRHMCDDSGLIFSELNQAAQELYEYECNVVENKED